MFDNNGNNLRRVENRWHPVTRQTVGDDTPILHDEMFGEGISHSHHHTALYLALQSERVENFTHVIRRNDLQDAHLTCTSVHFNPSCLSVKGKGKMHVP